MSEPRLLMLGGASLIAPGVMLIQLGPAERRGHARPDRGVGHVVRPGRPPDGGPRPASGSSPRSARRPCATREPRSSRRRTGRASTRQRCRRRARSVGDEGGLRLLVATDDDADVFQVVAATGGAEGVEGRGSPCRSFLSGSATGSSRTARTRSPPEEASSRTRSPYRRTRPSS
jgi:hypothetical protein